MVTSDFTVSRMFLFLSPDELDELDYLFFINGFHRFNRFWLLSIPGAFYICVISVICWLKKKFVLSVLSVGNNNFCWQEKSVQSVRSDVFNFTTEGTKFYKKIWVTIFVSFCVFCCFIHTR